MPIEEYPAVLAEGPAWSAGLCIERIEVLAANRDDALVGVLSPIRHAARALSGRFLQSRPGRLLDPYRAAGGGVERLDQSDAVRRVEHAIDHDWRPAKVVRGDEIGELLHQLRVNRRPAPHRVEVPHVVAVDLIKW